MISTIVQKRTFDLIAGGQRTIYFRHKDHWQRRFNGSSVHKAIILVSGRRCRAYKIESISDTGGSFKVLLGEEIQPWATQESLFTPPHRLSERLISA